MRSPFALLVLPVAAAVAAVFVSGVAAAPAHVSAGPPTVTLTTTNGKSYSSKTITAPAGREFLLVFSNKTAGKHNVSLENGELEYGATLTIGKGTTATIFTLKKGVYHYYSSVGKDENAGMSGTLTVK